MEDGFLLHDNYWEPIGLDSTKTNPLSFYQDSFFGNKIVNPDFIGMES